LFAFAAASPTAALKLAAEQRPFAMKNGPHGINCDGFVEGVVAQMRMTATSSMHTATTANQLDDATQCNAQ
jgi:hypothetical protein